MSSMRLVIDLQGAQGSSRLRGIGRYSRELVLAMAREHRDHEVIVALNATMEDGLDELRDTLRDVLPASAIHLWWGPVGAAEVVADRPARARGGEWLRARALAALRPDVLLITSIFEGAGDDIISRWPSALSRPPTVAICYDLIPLVQRADYLDGAWAGGLKEWYLRRLHEMLLTDGLLAISEASRSDVIQHIGYPADRVSNISAGIGPNFHPVPIDAARRGTLFARYGLREGFLLFVGGGDHRKNEAGLIRAHGLLPPALRRTHPLAIVGKVDRLALQATAREAGLASDDLILIGFVDEADLPVLYACCALFVLPSHYEGFGLPAAEAMACGAPTLGSNTASLPEVIGLSEATFNPSDPEDMARCIERGLSDTSFRQRLLANASSRAALFTWTNTAARAWNALEHLFPVRSPAPPRSLPRLAVTSPLPPLASGIADYTRELVPHLARHYDITLVTPGGSTEDEWLQVNFPVLGPDEFRARAARFDRVLHQLGNSQFHAFQLNELLPEFGGTATLHDSFLSGVERWRAAAMKDSHGLAWVLHDAHGWPAIAHLAAKGEDAAVARYPISLSVLRDADQVVQHSTHARDILRGHFGDAATRDILFIPQLRRALPLPDRSAARRRLKQPEEGLLVATFGAVAPTKLPDRLLAAWRRVAVRLGNARLVFVGEISRDCSDLMEKYREVGSGEVLMTGRVDQNEYTDWLQAADVAVQVRAQSRGESSRALLDCLAVGLPSIVNAHGALAELPTDAVLMMPDQFTSDELVTALLHLGRDPEARRTLEERARGYVRSNLSPCRVAASYRDAIEAAHETISTPSQLLQEADLPPGDTGDLAALSTAAVSCIPARRPPLLMLDAKLLSSEAGTFPRNLFQRLLICHAADLRVEPVQCDATGKWLTTPAVAEELLGLRVPGLQPKELAPASGDVLLTSAEALPIAPEQPLQRLRRRGTVVLAWLSRHDEAVRTELDGTLYINPDGSAVLRTLPDRNGVPAWISGLPWTK